MMKTKEFLSQYRNAEREITAKLEDIERLRALAEKATQTLSFAPGGGQASRENIIARLADMSREIDEDVKRLAEIKERVQAAIDTVEDGTLRTLLQYRYICGWKWEKLIVKMHYSYAHIFRLHGEALSEVKM